MRADEFMRKYGLDKDDDEQADHSLRGQALERARHPENMQVGTPHDWEDLERYLQQGEDQVPPQQPSSSPTPNPEHSPQSAHTPEAGPSKAK